MNEDMSVYYAALYRNDEALLIFKNLWDIDEISARLEKLNFLPEVEYIQQFIIQQQKKAIETALRHTAENRGSKKM